MQQLTEPSGRLALSYSSTTDEMAVVLIIRWLIFPLLGVIGIARSEEQASESQEYCQLETFEPRCWKNEVIVIEKAVYGRHQIGKCISAKEAAFSQESDFFGCSADVLDIVNTKCSGRKQCQIRVPDADLDRTRTCLPGLQMFLEISYRCLEVVEPDRSCVVSVTSSPLHIAAAAAAAGVAQSNIGCGTKSQPWMLEAPAGQRINISLLDFTAAERLTSQHLTRSTSHVTTSSSSSGSCVDEKHQYGYIIDKSSVNKKNVSVCHARSNRQTHVYLSTSNTLQLVLTNDPSANFLLSIEAVGCTNLIPPEDAWIKREDDKIIIGCYTSRQTWQLRCHDGRWTGVVSNCSQEINFGLSVSKSPLVFNVWQEYEVAGVVAVGFTGLSVCLLIICCGLVCLRRFYAKYYSQKTLNVNNSKVPYSSMEPDDVRLLTEARHSTVVDNSRNLVAPAAAAAAAGSRLSQHQQYYTSSHDDVIIPRV